MEFMVRGAVEKLLDETTPDELKWILELFGSNIPVSNKEDFLLGYVVGYIYALIRAPKFIQKTDLTQSETEEYRAIIERRFMDIKGKIKLALGT
jgi:hypothetical protein